MLQHSSKVVSSKRVQEKASIGNGKQYIDIFLCCFSLHFFWGGKKSRSWKNSYFLHHLARKWCYMLAVVRRSQLVKKSPEKNNDDGGGH